MSTTIDLKAARHMFNRGETLNILERSSALSALSAAKKNANGEILHLQNCISLRYNFATGTRNIKLLNSGQIRRIREVCIFSINGYEVTV